MHTPQQKQQQKTQQRTWYTRYKSVRKMTTKMWMNIYSTKLNNHFIFVRPMKPELLRVTLSQHLVAIFYYIHENISLQQTNKRNQKNNIRKTKKTTNVQMLYSLQATSHVDSLSSYLWELFEATHAFVVYCVAIDTRRITSNCMSLLFFVCFNIGPISSVLLLL